MENELDFKLVPPDKGWAWVVMIASFLIQFLNDGILYCYSAFYEELGRDFNTTKAQIAVTNSYSGFFYFFAGIVGNPLINFFGCRFVGILAGVLGSFSFAISSTFNYHVYLLHIFVGILGGMGLGFSFYAAIVVTGFYFDKHRSLAIGIGTSGTGFGQLIIPPIIDVIRRNYGWRITFIAIGVALLLNIVLAMSYFPLEPLPKDAPPEEKSKPIYGCRFKKDERMKLKNETCKDKLIKILDYTLLKSPAFWVYLFSGMILNAAYMCLCNFIIQRAKDFKISDDKAVLALSLLGVGNSIGRITVGALRSVERIDQIYLSAVFFIIAGILCLMGSFPFCSVWYVQLILATLNGFFFSPYCMRPVVAIDLFGIERLTNAFGLNMLTMGLGIFTINYTYSIVYEHTNNFIYVFAISLILCIITSVLYLLLRPIRKWEKKKGILPDTPT